MSRRDSPVLTFDWSMGGKIPGLLLMYFFASLLLHVLGFYVFQVVYPPHVTISPPPAIVSVLTPTAENAPLFRWIEAEDPALLAQPQEVLPAHLFESKYRPSFAEPRSAPRLPAEKPEQVEIPHILDSTIFREATTTRKTKETKPVAAPKTELRFSKNLAPRITGINSPIDIRAKSSAELEPTIFLIGVHAEGDVRFVFLQKSSGEKSLDDEAEAHLKRLKFAPAHEALAWGTASFFWGGDVFENPKSKNEDQKTE